MLTQRRRPRPLLRIGLVVMMLCFLATAWLGRSVTALFTPMATSTPQVVRGPGPVLLAPDSSVVFNSSPLSLPAGSYPDPAGVPPITVTNQSDQAATVTRTTVLTIEVAEGFALQVLNDSGTGRFCKFGAQLSSFNDSGPANRLACESGPTGISALSFTVMAYPAGRMVINQVHYPVGWNLIAAPAGTILPPSYTDQSEDSGYQRLPSGTPSQAGRGYWAYFDIPQTQPLAARGPASIAVALPAGQPVMIGNPGNTPVAVTGADTVTTYDPVSGTYQPATLLQPGQGAWAVSAGGGTVTLDPTTD